MESIRSHDVFQSELLHRLKNLRRGACNSRESRGSLRGK